MPGRAVRGERGMVSVELAFAALFATVLTIVLAMVIGLAVLLARCHETAAEVARQEARDDPQAVARAVAHRPRGAVVAVREDEAQVVVTVSVLGRPWGDVLPGVPLSAQAVVLREPR